MSICILNASHRHNGFCDKAENIIFELNNSLHDIVKIKTIEKKVNYCRACDHCEITKGECVIKDDMQDIYKKILYSDKIVVISPIYFSSLPASLKTIIDRTQMIYNMGSDNIPKKEFYLILFGGSSAYPEQFKGARETFTYLIKHINAEIKAYINIPSTDTMGEILPGEITESIKQFAKLIYS